jgi:hypothetical protein
MMGVAEFLCWTKKTGQQGRKPTDHCVTVFKALGRRQPLRYR